jgi:hypothetical protein
MRVWAFPRGAEATEGGHPRINIRLPEDPSSEVGSADKDRFWKSQIGYGRLDDFGRRGGKIKTLPLFVAEPLSYGAKTPRYLKATEVLMNWFLAK